MVGQEVVIRDNKRGLKKGFKFFIIVVILFIVGAAFYLAYLKIFETKPSSIRTVILPNPLNDLILKNTDNSSGEDIVDAEKVVEQGISEFNETYINYLLVALGANKLKYSIIYRENPFIEIKVEEIWNSEIVKGKPVIKQGNIDNEDIRIILSKEEAVKAMLSPDIKEYMKESVNNGKTKIEQIAGQTELFTKGYLDMYNEMK